MKEDFVTRLQLQLRDAAAREARRGAFGHAFLRTRRQIMSPAAAGGLAALLAVIAVVAGVVLLRDEPEPSAPRVVANLDLTGNPAQILSAYGSVWIADSVAGDVVRVDPETRRVLARIPVGTGVDLVMEPVEGELWVRSDDATELERIDPATDRIVGRVPLRTPAGEPFGARSVLSSPGGVWAIDLEGALQLDPRTGRGLRVVGARTAETDVRGFALGEDVLWSLRTDGRIQRYDAGTGEQLGDFASGLEGADGIFGYGPDVMAGIGNTFARLDGSTGRVLWERSIGDRVNASAAARRADLGAHQHRAPVGPAHRRRGRQREDGDLHRARHVRQHRPDGDGARGMDQHRRRRHGRRAVLRSQLTR